MSSVVTTLTPFLNRTVLLDALNRVGCKCTVHGDEIITDRRDYFGNQKFILKNGQYYFQHDSDSFQAWIGFSQSQPANAFLQLLEREYLKVEHLLAEQERERIEQERREYVQKMKNQVIEKAKTKGFSVKEENVNRKVKLVLRRVVY